ncbi:MAG TPA: hypothetical protein ENO18_00915, partial [Caldithrix sp.]|nr:hypothetical protein [Caldithrix sp.]
MQSKIFSLFIIFFLIMTYTESYPVITSSFPDIQIISSDQNSLIFEWQPQGLSIESSILENQTYKVLSFHYGEVVSDIGAVNIPWRILKIGVPEEGIQSVHITNLQSQSYSNIKVMPVPHPYKDSKGLTNYSYQINQLKYAESALQSRLVYQLLDSDKFRDFNTQKLMLTPFSYDADKQNLTVHSRIRVQINFAKSSVSVIYKERSKFDTYYKDFILNFDTAKNWQISQHRLSKLSRVASLPPGPFYQTPVTEDGLYKITASTVENSDISLDNISINSIQMFNNGGHMLSYRVTDENYNPPHTLEIPIFVSDQNNNNLFDGADYILFYGKALNSWYYNYTARQFQYQTHP